jgi:hypothetical protein
LGDLLGRIESSDALSGVKARRGRLDLKDLALFHADKEVAPAHGIGRVDPIDGAAADVIPLLVLGFLGK